MSTKNHSSSATANPNNQDEGVKAMNGIDKRPNKDGTDSYRVRVRIKGHPLYFQFVPCFHHHGQGMGLDHRESSTQNH